MSSTESSEGHTVKVLKSMMAVQAALAKKGIAKTQKNQGQGFNFRGIDQVMTELSPLLAEHQLLMLPEVLDREVTERTNARGNTLQFVWLRVRYTVYADDGSTVHLVSEGEGMDSGDKATNKAMSAAYKYAVLQGFAVPVQGVYVDGDAESQEMLPQHQPSPPSSAQAPAQGVSTGTPFDGCTTRSQLTKRMAGIPESDRPQHVSVFNKLRQELPA